MNKDERFLAQMASVASVIMRRRFVPGGVAFQMKSDQTPVTKADLEIGTKVEEMVRDAYPDAVLIREEKDFPNRKGYGIEFIVDELDGTDGFSRDIPLAVFAAARLFDCVVQDAIIHAPLAFGVARSYTAASHRGVALLNGKPIHVVSDRRERLRIGIATSAHKAERYHAFRIAQALADLGHIMNSVTSISHSCAMVAAGHLDGVLFPWDTLHDTAPGDLLVREAGGVTSDLNGNKLTYAGNSVEGFIMANSLATHGLLLDLAQQHRREPEK